MTKFFLPSAIRDDQPWRQQQPLSLKDSDDRCAVVIQEVRNKPAFVDELRVCI